MKWIVILGAGGLWIAGLRLFIRSPLSTRRKWSWATLLVAAGIAIGVILRADQIWSRFLLLSAILPFLAALDHFLVNRERGLSFWIRACGFEIVSVFGVAAIVRWAIGVR